MSLLQRPDVTDVILAMVQERPLTKHEIDGRLMCKAREADSERAIVLRFLRQDFNLYNYLWALTDLGMLQRVEVISGAKTYYTYRLLSQTQRSVSEQPREHNTLE